MKSSFSFVLSAFAAALLGAMSFVPITVSAKSTEDSVHLRVELDRPVLAAGRTERAVIKVSLDGTRVGRPEKRAPINLTLVMDRSGSMAGDKIDNAKAAAIEAVRR